jgi:hypothetical protein
MVFNQSEHISLHVLGELSQLCKADPLIEAPTIVVVTLDLDGHLFQAFFREFRQACVQ